MSQTLATAIGHAGLVVAAATPAWMAWRFGRPHGARLVGTLLLVAVVVVALQAFFMRERPGDVPYLVLGLPFYSFPSGHAAMAFASATYVAMLRPSWSIGCLLGATLVATSRVAGGVHFVTDVVAGAGIGAGFAATVCGIGRDTGSRPAWAWLGFGWLGLQVAMAAFASAGIGSVETILFPRADKVLHVLVFGLMAFFAVAWFRDRSAVTVILFLVGITLLEERAQAFWPGRSVDFADALASAIGVVGFGLLAARLRGTTASTDARESGILMT